MAEITRSIDVDAAIGDVDQEWTQFMFRTLVGHYQGRAGGRGVDGRPTTPSRRASCCSRGSRTTARA